MYHIGKFHVKIKGKEFHGSQTAILRCTRRMSTCAVDSKLMLHVHINSVAECQPVHIVEGVGQNRQTHSTDTTYSSQDHATSHSHQHWRVRCWWLCDITWVIKRRFSTSNGDERDCDVRLTFVLMRTTVLNYTSEMLLNGDIPPLRGEVTCSVNETLQGRADVHVSLFLSSFLSLYFSCLFLVPLFFRCPFLHFYFSCHLPIHSVIHSFINPNIKLSVHLSIHPLTGESNFYSFFYFFLPLSSFLSFPLSSVFYSDIVLLSVLFVLSLFQFSNYSAPFPLSLFNFPINSTRGKPGKNKSRLDP